MFMFNYFFIFYIHFPIHVSISRIEIHSTTRYLPLFSVIKGHTNTHAHIISFFGCPFLFLDLICSKHTHVWSLFPAFFVQLTIVKHKTRTGPWTFFSSSGDHRYTRTHRNWSMGSWFWPSQQTLYKFDIFSPFSFLDNITYFSFIFPIYVNPNFAIRIQKSELFFLISFNSNNNNYFPKTLYKELGLKHSHAKQPMINENKQFIVTKW